MWSRFAIALLRVKIPGCCLISRFKSHSGCSDGNLCGVCDFVFVDRNSRSPLQSPLAEESRRLATRYGRVIGSRRSDSWSATTIGLPTVSVAVTYLERNFGALSWAGIPA